MDDSNRIDVIACLAELSETQGATARDPLDLAARVLGRDSQAEG